MLRISHPSRSGASHGENDGRHPNRSDEIGMTILPTSLATSDDAVGDATYPIAGRFRLTDGRLVRLRPLQAEDAPRLLDLCKRLSPSTIRRRFLRSVVRCNPLEAQRLAAVDQVQRMALVAVPDPADDPPIVAVGRFHGDGSDQAELALLVDDAYQHVGLGRLMLGHLVREAVQRRLRVLEGHWSTTSVSASRCVIYRAAPLPAGTASSHRQGVRGTRRADGAWRAAVYGCTVQRRLGGWRRRQFRWPI